MKDAIKSSNNNDILYSQFNDYVDKFVILNDNIQNRTKNINKLIANIVN